MDKSGSLRSVRLWSCSFLVAASALFVASCGGGGSTGNPTDSGTNKTYLSVAATDADGDALQYQWRVTAGSIENRNSSQTVWTMPDGPGLHFAYVTISDGKGGYVEQQYAASSDSLGTSVAPSAGVSRAPPTTTTTSWSAGRLRFSLADPQAFSVSGGSAKVSREVYLPDVQVQLERNGSIAFSGATDLAGELSLPALEAGAYAIKCATVQGAPLVPCDSSTPSLTVVADGTVTVLAVHPTLPAARNLRVFGHVALADGSACGAQNEFFGLQSAATVQLLQADGTALAAPTRVNHLGDYAIDAAALATGAYNLVLTCEGYTSAALAVPPSPDPLGYVSTVPLELSVQMPNHRPSVIKMVANGADGNVRGAMIVPEAGASTGLPGWSQFLAYKGHDTRMSACIYYQSLGAVTGCDAQGGLQNPITLDDWKRQHKLAPYDSGNAQVAATYINRMDLNLVRRMHATQAAPTDIAFYVCNHPGPEGSTQEEVDSVLETGLGDQKLVACVAMEWSVSPGVNGGKPFTKFLTFGPGGALIPSVNLDGRGEKFMPGACVACHGGTQYNGRFSDRGTPSPYLGSGFLPFDTGNYMFGSAAGLSEGEQSRSIHDLNMLVRATDQFRPYQSTAQLIDGWYAGGTKTLNKQYVPQAWLDAEAGSATAAPKVGASILYREVIGRTCRTCHASMGSFRFDWDANVGVVTDPNGVAHAHFCGGTSDLVINGSMPNALISRDRLADRISADAALATVVETYLGCRVPAADPAYAKR
jgi:mono/diheme cytochrome c family protein